MNDHTPCPCGTGKGLSQCCGPLLDGHRDAGTAEALMRSRYSAYALGRLAYLTATWHPTTRRHDLEHDEPVTWIGLQVLRTEAGGPDDREGVVEFVARYKVFGRAHRLHEVSRFLRREGRWYYVDGEPGPSSR